MKARLACVALLTLACGPSSSSVDAGVDAFASIDAASVDAPSIDVGTDASIVDAFTRDAFALDAAEAGTDAGPVPCVGPPGLYVDDDCTVVSSNLRAYHPRFALWSDGDTKERFVYLPPGTHIDTSDPDRWGFPMGTRLYKTFSVGGIRVETRILEKVAAPRGTSSWTMTAYLWSADQRSVTVASAFGASDVLGTGHDVPSHAECVRCHSVAQDDAINGFSAIQLAHDEGGVTLATLDADGWLTTAIDTAAATIPGDTTAVAALGYMHANCGNCHGGPTPERDMSHWIHVGTPDVAHTTTWMTAVCTCSVWTRTLSSGDVADLRIDPSHPDVSVEAIRMSTRVLTDQMPPIGTHVVDTAGVALVTSWIASLNPTANGCPHGCPFP